MGQKTPRTAIAFNEAGKLVRLIGDALIKIGQGLYGFSGYLDARADSAGYWDSRP